MAADRRTYQRLTERIVSWQVEARVDGSVRTGHSGIAGQLPAAAINAAADLGRWVPSVTSETATNLYSRPALLGLLCAESGSGSS